MGLVVAMVMARAGGFYGCHGGLRMGASAAAQAAKDLNLSRSGAVGAEATRGARRRGSNGTWAWGAPRRSRSLLPSNMSNAGCYRTTWCLSVWTREARRMRGWDDERRLQAAITRSAAFVRRAEGLNCSNAFVDTGRVEFEFQVSV